jgi:coronin-1B/1C/6
MSGRFVRASKFRHIHGDQPKLEQCFQELRPQTSGESNYIAANRKYFAVGVLGGGGPLLVHPLDQPKRFPAKYPVINVHKGKILDIDFNPFFDDLVAMASDDGTASMCRIPEEFKENIRDPLVHLTGHQKRIGALTFNPAASNILATGSYDNTIKIWDVEAQAEVLELNCFGDYIQNIQWNTDGSQMVVTCKDKKIRIIDPRQADAVVTVDGFAGAKSQRGVFLDNHGKLVVTGFTKTACRAYRIYDPKNMSSYEEEELDQAAGVLLPFYDPDTSVLYITGKGDGLIRYFEMEDGVLHHLSDFRSNTPHKGVCFTPKTGVDYMSCEVAFCLRLQRSLVEPIHFIVPRKSELYQEDLYPPTYAGKPSVTAEEWLSGQNKAPEKIDIREAADAAGGAEFVAKKSPAELEKELAEANARIAELEALVAKLQGN